MIVCICCNAVHGMAFTSGRKTCLCRTAREQIGDGAILGLSTHTPEQAALASREDIDYVAIGPVFATTTKLDAEPVVGLCALQATRALVRKAAGCDWRYDLDDSHVGARGRSGFCCGRSG